jgi:hypothetical protein
VSIARLNLVLHIRNLDLALGLLEERIDHLLQMSQAATDQALGIDDLSKPLDPEQDTHGRISALHPPALPSLQDDNSVRISYVLHILCKHVFVTKRSWSLCTGR